jgi:F0F1-type ATP synthase assembly protein I
MGIPEGNGGVDYIGPVSQQPPSEQPRKLRRSPNFKAFLITGGLVGLLIGFILSVFGQADARYDASATLGYLGLICASLGVLVGGIIAVLLDRRT